MIIDCHGHYTTTPQAHQGFRDAQLARLADPGLTEPPSADIGDEQIRESIENNQLRLLRERGRGPDAVFAESIQHGTPCC